MSKRGIRRVSMRVRLAVAAAVLVGGGAGVAVAATSSSSTVNANSAGYYSSRSFSPMQGFSQSLHVWNRSRTTAIIIIANITRFNTFGTFNWHHKNFAASRGQIVALSNNQFVLRSATNNGSFQIWHFNGGTKVANVGALTGSMAATGMKALQGGVMNLPSTAVWNTTARTATTGSQVLVFGQRTGGRLNAQLVLFVTPTGTTTGTTTTTPVTTPNVTNTTTINGQTAITGTHS